MTNAEKAARAVARWNLGYPEWGTLFYDIITAKDPVNAARSYLSHSEHMDVATLDEMLPVAAKEEGR